MLKRYIEFILLFSGISERHIIKEPLRINNLEWTKKFVYIRLSEEIISMIHAKKSPVRVNQIILM